MTAVSKPSSSNTRLPWSRVGLIALTATFGAAIVNVVVYVLAGALGVDWSFVVPQMGAPIPVVAPFAASLVGVGLGMVVFAALNAFTAQPVLWFTWVALVAGLASLSGPVTIPGVPFNLMLTLMLMHVVAITFSILTPRWLGAASER